MNLGGQWPTPGTLIQSKWCRDTRTVRKSNSTGWQWQSVDRTFLSPEQGCCYDGAGWMDVAESNRMATTEV